MPSRRDGRIEPGQPLRSAISASAWNRAQDAADVVLGERPAFAAEGPASVLPPFHRVKLRWRAASGDTSKVLRPYHYATIGGAGSGHTEDGGLLNAPRISLNQNTTVADVPVFSNPSDGVFARYFDDDNAASAKYIFDRVAIALEPIRNDSIGWAAIGGVCPAKIDIANNAYRYAMPQWVWHTSSLFGPSTLRVPKCTSANDGEWRLQANWFAGYPIVWRDNVFGVTDDVWAYVDLSTFWAHPLVLALPTGTNGLSHTGRMVNATSQAVQLYVNRTTPSGMYVSVSNYLDDVPANRFVWLANPFGMRQYLGWHVVAADG